MSTMSIQEKVMYLENKNIKLKEEVQRLRISVKNYKYDSLTGLLLRGDFNTRYDEFWFDHIKFNSRFILAMIDLNGLHALNRDISFEAGDDLIRTVATQLKELFEDSNIFRIGCDEFTILKRGNNIQEFNQRLSLIEDCEVYSVSVEDTYADQSEMFNAVDNGLKQLKLKNKKSRDS